MKHPVFAHTQIERDIIHGYVDADWASFELDRHSTSGFVFKVFDCTVTWGTKKQNCIALSSTEAEYVALTDGVKEAKWLLQTLKDLGFLIENPVTIFEDNMGCICIASNPVKHHRTKHIDVRYHYIRKEIKDKNINLQYICTQEQQADIFTKITPPTIFKRLKAKIGLHDF